MIGIVDPALSGLSVLERQRQLKEGTDQTVAGRLPLLHLRRIKIRRASQLLSDPIAGLNPAPKAKVIVRYLI
jgi:hypothetical protein